MAKRRRSTAASRRRAQASRINRRISTRASNRRRSSQARRTNRKISRSLARSRSRAASKARKAATRSNRKRALQARRTNVAINRRNRRAASRENQRRGAAAKRANRQIAKAERRRRKKESTRENVDDPDALTLVEIAAVNEFGSYDGRVPERSYMRSTFDKNVKRYTTALSRAVGRVIDGKSSIDDELDLLGLRVVTDIKRTIGTLREPPNAAMTIERKGSSKPLIDTGRLRASIDHEVRRDR